MYVYNVAVHHVAQVQMPQDIRCLRRTLQHLCGVQYMYLHEGTIYDKFLFFKQNHTSM